MPTVLIDGYNLMHALGLASRAMPPAEFEKARLRFLNWLADLPIAKTNARIWVVFDAQQGAGPSSLQRHRRVEFEYAMGQTADDRIEELLQLEADLKDWRVVSNDGRVRLAASRAGARPLSSEQFLDLANSPPKPTGKQGRGEKPIASLSAADSAELLEVFQQVEAELPMERYAKPPKPPPPYNPKQLSILVTAGNTQVMLDRVRCITNIFSGRTGARIAATAYQRGHAVTLLTSHPEVLDEWPENRSEDRWQVRPYRTFEELADLMAATIPNGPFDALILAAAVSDFLPAGSYTPAIGTHFQPTNHQWASLQGHPPTLKPRPEGKVPSDTDELWLRMLPAPKLIDRVRSEWKFRGTLVKFKLEVDKREKELVQIAERSRAKSEASLMVANSLEGMSEFAFLGSGHGSYQKVVRNELADKLLEQVERLGKRPL